MAVSPSATAEELDELWRELCARVMPVLKTYRNHIRDIEVRVKTDSTFLTDADSEVQDIVIGVIRGYDSASPIIAEEDTAFNTVARSPVISGDGAAWIIDPIDGTSQFIRPDGIEYCCILARKAQLAGDMGNALDAIDVGEAAARMAGSRNRLAAMATTFAGHGYALAQAADESERAFDRALDLLDLGRERQPSLGVWLDAAYVEVHRARSRAVLCDWKGAAAGFEQAIASLPSGFPRDRGVYLARAAIAYAGAQEAEAASSLGIAAVAIGAQTGSGRIRRELQELDRAISCFDTSSTAQFRDVLHETFTA